jgi:hypothetical protein
MRKKVAETVDWSKIIFILIHGEPVISTVYWRGAANRAYQFGENQLIEKSYLLWRATMDITKRKVVL